MKPTNTPHHNSTASNVWFMIRGAFHEWKQILVLCILFSFLDLMSRLVQLYIVPVILEQVQTGVPAGRLVCTLFLFCGLLFVANAGRTYVDENLYFGAVDFRFKLLNDVITKLSTTSYPNVESPKFQEKLAQAGQTVSTNDKATEAIWRTLRNLLRDGLGLILYLVLLSRMPLALLLTVIATTVLSFLISNRMNSWAYRHRVEEGRLEKRLSYLYSRASDNALAKDIRIFGMQNWIKDMYDSAKVACLEFSKRKFNRRFLAAAADIVFTVLRNGLAYFFLIRMTIRGQITVPMFLLYFSAFSGLVQWITGLLEETGTLHRQSLEISELREFLDYEETFQFEQGKKVPKAGNYTLTLDNVRFRYPGASKDTIPCMNLTIHAGEKVAIVGLNGAGKTTLIKLLCGFEDPTEGRVLLNGEDIRTMNRRDYYGLFTAVFQVFATMSATIEELVAMRIDSIDEAKVREALAQVGLLEKVLSFPQGLKSHLGKDVWEDGVVLSGGEMQRLILARALYRNAPILVLDEPTAALDPIAEDQIYRRYDAMTERRTSIFISHRLASTRFCDRILMMDKGTIIEEGTHDELVGRGGAYAELFAVQSRYYWENVPTEGERA